MKNFSIFVLAATLGIGNAANATVLSSFAKTYSGSTPNAAKYDLPTPDRDGISIDFTFNFTKTTTLGLTDELENNDFLGFWFNNSTGPSFGLKANCNERGTCTDDLFVRLGGAEGVFIPGSDLTNNTDYRIFGYLYKSEGSSFYDNFDMWLNPTSFEMQTLSGADAHASSARNGSGTSRFTQINSVGFRSANLDHGVRVTVKDVNLNVDAAVIPEPSSIALMGLALAGLGLTRRKINK